MRFLLLSLMSVALFSCVTDEGSMGASGGPADDFGGGGMQEVYCPTGSTPSFQLRAPGTARVLIHADANSTIQVIVFPFSHQGGDPGSGFYSTYEPELNYYDAYRGGAQGRVGGVRTSLNPESRGTSGTGGQWDLDANVERGDYLLTASARPHQDGLGGLTVACRPRN